MGLAITITAARVTTSDLRPRTDNRIADERAHIPEAHPTKALLLSNRMERPRSHQTTMQADMRSFQRLARSSSNNSLRAVG